MFEFTSGPQLPKFCLTNTLQQQWKKYLHPLTDFKQSSIQLLYYYQQKCTLSINKLNDSCFCYDIIKYYYY